MVNPRPGLSWLEMEIDRSKESVEERLASNSEFLLYIVKMEMQSELE